MLKVYLEAMLDGFVNCWHGGRATVYEVESKEEFDELLERNSDMRAVIVNGRMFVSPEENGIHLDMMRHIKKQEGITFVVPLNDTIYDAMNASIKKNLKQYLLVQMNGNGAMQFGESYYWESIEYVGKLLKTPTDKLRPTDKAVKEALMNHIAVIKKFTTFIPRFL